MREIPFLKIRDKKMSLNISSGALRSLLNQLNENTVYVLDEDGVAKDNPNVSLYQRLTSAAELWVDAGPRHFGDIVDDLFSGAHRIVIRSGLWEESDLKSVIDITENELMGFYDAKELCNGVPRDPIFSQVHGIILHFDKYSEHIDFKMEGFIKQIAKINATYILDEIVQRKEKWGTIGIKGVFVPIELMDVEMDG